MSVKITLIKTFFASSWGKTSGILIRLVQVPILLTALGVDDYGRWLVLSSIPSWLTLANLGFGSVAANEMSMATSAGEYDKAKSIFSTTVSLVFAIFVFGSIIVLFVAPFIGWENFLKIPSIRHNELVWAVVWFSMSIFLSFAAEAFAGRLRAARKVHQSVLVSSFRPWFEFLGMLFVLQFSTRFDYLALSMLISTILFLVILNWISLRAYPSLSFSLKSVKKQQFKLLFQKGIAFQAFPLGNAMLFQGNLLIIQSILGPAAVALFGTARTLVRTVNQVMDLINQSIWPELSHLFGMGDYKRAAQLHRIGVGMAITFSVIGVFFLALFGQIFYGWWVGSAISLPQHLLIIFLLPIPFNALWFTSSVVHLASNKHEGLAIRYLIATCLSVITCIFLSYLYGIEGAAISTLVADIVLIPYVLKQSLLLTQDSFPEFTSGLIRELRSLPIMVKKMLKLN